MARSQPVLPYRVLPATAVQLAESGWELLIEGAPKRHLRSGDSVVEWDPKLAFRLERHVGLTYDLRRDLGIVSRSRRCRLVVTAASSNRLVREVLFQRELDQTGPQELTLSIAPNSARLAKDLWLTTGLYLCDGRAGDDPLAPSLEGSALWETTDHLRLEGGSARLPMYEVSFAQAFPADRIDLADMHVEIAGDLGLEVESALTVYLNSDRADFVADVSRGGTAAERRLWNDIIRRAITTAVLSEMPELTAADTPGTLGATLRRWITHIWPNTPVEQIAELASSGYSLFESQINSYLCTLQDPDTAKTK